MFRQRGNSQDYGGVSNKRSNAAVVLKCEIAEILDLSEPRVSQLVRQLTLKLIAARQRLGLAE